MRRREESGAPGRGERRALCTGAEAVARAERARVGRALARDPAVAEGLALAGVCTASLSEGAIFPSSAGATRLDGVSCVHHVVAPAGGTRGGAFELAAACAQQAVDHAAAAHRLSARLGRPGVCTLDPRLAERLALVSLPEPPASGAAATEGAGSAAEGSRDLTELARDALRRVGAERGRAADAAHYEGDAGAELVFVAAGPESGPAREAAAVARAAGLRTGALSLRLLRPFPESAVRERLAGARTVALVEGPEGAPDLAAALRRSADEECALRVIGPGTPAALLAALPDRLPAEALAATPARPGAKEALPARSLAVVPGGPWGAEAARTALAALSRRGPLRTGSEVAFDEGASVIAWEPEGAVGEPPEDLLLASHPEALEVEGALGRLRPGSAALLFTGSAPPESALGALPEDVRRALRERGIRLHAVAWPGPEAEAPAAGTDRAAALLLAGGALAVTGGEAAARETLAGAEDAEAPWLRLGAEGVRALDPQALGEETGPPELDFRPKSALPRLPEAEEADEAERERTAEAVRRFHRAGRASPPLGPDLPLRPAALDGLVEELRHAAPHPLVLLRSRDAARPLAARRLSALLAEGMEELRASGREASALAAHLPAFAPEAARLLREGEGRGRVGALLAETAKAVTEELGLPEREAEALRQESAALCELLPAEAEVLSLRDELPLELYRAAADAVRTPLLERFRERLATLRERLRDLLQIDRMSSREGRSPAALAAELGGGAARLLDPKALARTLPGGRGGTLAPERRERIEAALARIEAALAGEGPEAGGTVFLQPPGLELPLPAEARRVHADPLAAAVGYFDGAALRMAPLFRAVRVAELEVEGRYRPERHDAVLADLDWEALTAEELALVPPVAVVTTGRSLRRRGLASLSELLRSSRPVHVLVRDEVLAADEAEDPSRFHLDLGYLVMAHREAFAVASGLARPERLAEALVRMVGAPRPGVALVHLPSRELAPWHALVAEAALQGRACPELVYDPDAGTSWASRFDLSANPQPERAWSLRRVDYRDAEGDRSLEVAFTFADAAALEIQGRGHLRLLPRHAWDDAVQRPLAEYLERFDPEGRDPAIPYLWVVDPAGRLQRAVVTRALALAARDRLRGWRVLQELAGFENAHAERAATAAREEAVAEAAREREALERAHAEALAGARTDGARESMERLAAALLRPEGAEGLAALGAPAAPRPRPAPEATAAAPAEAPAEPAPEPEPAEAEEEEEPLPIGEPWVDTPLCTSCNECTGINARLFAYNGDKQAYIADPAAGSFAELVKAAELCPARCIHPGKPRGDDPSATPELVERAAAFG